MINRNRLKNGLLFLHKELPGTGIVDVRLMLRAGALYDKALNMPPGTAHFLEHIVHEKTEKYPNREDLLNVVTLKGGQRNATTHMSEKMNFFATVLKEERESAADFVSQLTLHSVLTPEAVEKHRSIITQECLAGMKEPSQKARRAFMKAALGGTGTEFSALGNLESIAEISLDQMQRIYDERFKAEHAVLAIYGDIDKVEAETLAEKYFGSMKTDMARDESFGSKNHFSRDACKDAEAAIDDKKKKFEFVEIADAQAVVHYGGMTNGRSDRTYYARAVLLQILAGDATSILYKILRDEKHLLYHIGHAPYNADTFGTFSFTLNLAPENIQQSLDIIKSEMGKIAAGEVKESLMDTAKIRMRARELFDQQSIQNLADNDATTFLLYPELNDPCEWVEKIEAVTKEEIVAEAKTMLAHLTILAVCSNKREEYEF